MTRDDAMHTAPTDGFDDAVTKIDAELHRLPPIDAPERTVQRTLERVAAARDRVPGRSFGWVLVAAASLVGLVGAWFAAHSVGGDAAPPMTQVDQLARYQTDAGSQSGRYRLRGAEVRASIAEPVDAANDEVTRAFQGGQPGVGGEEGRVNRELVPTSEELRNEVTAAEQDIPYAFGLDKTGELDPDTNKDRGRDLAANGVAFHDDSLDGGLKVLDGKGVAEVVDKETKVIASLEVATAPTEAKVRIDGTSWSTVSLATRQDDAGTERDHESARGEDKWHGAGPAPADQPDHPGDVAGPRLPPPATTDATTALAQPVTNATTVAAGEHTVVANGDGYLYETGTVVTRVPPPVSGLVLVPEEAAAAAVNKPVVTDPTEREPSEADLRVARDSVAGQQPELGWWRNTRDGRGDMGGGDALTGDLDPAQREHAEEGERASGSTKANPAFASLAGKRALAPREMVPSAAAVEGLVELTPRGYFRNTYLPGDPENSWLRASLADRLTKDGAELPLEQAARPPVQPFAVSADRGLGVSVTADRVAVAGPTRMTLQIGLAGADRPATRRAPLNLALVLDVAAVSSEAERQTLWSLADALAAARQPGDRFTVLVTGAAPEDAQVLAASELSGPEVRRALATAFEARQAPAAGDLDKALDRAVAEVRGGVRAGAPLGADMVIVASSRTVAAEARATLEERAREAAVSGINVSAIGVGPRADSGGLAALAAAGQGRRLLANDSEGARSVMARELVASGRAVARAVRLRIRLADGVKLIAVLGSEPLDAVDAERVRVAEKAIDKQVRAATGIASDRGADEDGIQIVIPAFYAGDRHVILLDVVAPGPGPLVDVRVRFKDLVALDNGEASASLALTANPQDVAPSPVGRNVVANRAAYSVGEALLEASRALAAGDRHAAWEALATARAGLTQLETVDPGLDAALASDAAVLDQYLALMRDADAWNGDPTLVAWVSRSLHLAARIKGLR